jgi:AAA family ATPase
VRQDNQYRTNNQARYEILNEKKEAKLIILKAIGYPLESNYIESPEVEVKNKELFDIYANDQWNGYKVHKYQYLFDQKLLPDFAYQIIDVRPDNSYITSNTSFLVLPPEKKSIETVQKQKYHVDDVIGQQKAKDKSRIITKYLEDPDKFENWAPKNILFYGMPGTGKTMLAQALANELDVPIKMIKATSLIGDHVGDGSKQIHELYEQARNNKPTVIFIDEIDAIGLERKYQSLRGDVTEIVNALLTEMDGIEDNESIITICATNNPQLLDYAIRSRFEEEIEFTLPNEEERRKLLETNIKTMPLECNFSMDVLVTKTKGFSGRDLKEKILKTAMHKAISESEDIITDRHIEYAIKESSKEVKIQQDNMFV